MGNSTLFNIQFRFFSQKKQFGYNNNSSTWISPLYKKTLKPVHFCSDSTTKTATPRVGSVGVNTSLGMEIREPTSNLPNKKQTQGITRQPNIIPQKKLTDTQIINHLWKKTQFPKKTTLFGYRYLYTKFPKGVCVSHVQNAKFRPKFPSHRQSSSSTFTAVFSAWPSRVVFGVFSRCK